MSNNTSPLLIGIGAINFDFIFSNNTSDSNGSKDTYDDGEESFISQINFKNEFNKAKSFVKNSVKTQIGGSSLLAIKTAKNMCSNVRTAYVGVYGKTPVQQVKDTTLPADNQTLRKELSTFIDDMTWVFEEPSVETGMALVKQHKHRRHHIDILPGANDLLLNKIQQSGESHFIDFLSSANWIHISSLSNIEQFKTICDYLEQAKTKNPFLTISVDPGFAYTKNHIDVLQKIFPISDFVFLNKTELSNISYNLGLSTKDKLNILGQEMLNMALAPQVLIIKNKNKSLLLNLIDGAPFVRTYYHKKLLGIRILNDTGAGDAFAGGFIAGMLSPKMLSYQPAPIRMGTIAATERMRAQDWPNNLKSKAHDFYKKNMKDEKSNKKQWLKIHFPFLEKPIVDMIIGIITGVIATFIVEWIVELLKNK